MPAADTLLVFALSTLALLAIPRPVRAVRRGPQRQRGNRAAGRSPDL